MPHLQAADVTFFELRNTVFCVQCELMSYNNTSNCLACGSTALIMLGRILGGSLGNHERARLISDEAINGVVENILQKNEVGELPTSEIAFSSGADQLTHSATSSIACRTLPHALPQLQPAMRWVVERACTITSADGAALALARQGRLICHAQAGVTAPDLGVELAANHGISGLCASTGMSWRCDSADSDPNVDRGRCRDLGAQSVIAAPVSHLNSVLGVLEVFSSHRNAFSDHDVATVQLLAGLVVVSITRGVRPGTVLESTHTSALAPSRVARRGLAGT
ncbi:MAG TPA: GAF domain-containing protein [Terriglobales bacterium]|jgi:GAF domain-containing protein|nr:GAF domain-containing protein [Terriglobales bacterium]